MFDKNKEVSQIMTTQVICTTENETMDGVAEIFRSKDIHHIPVIRDRCVVGILSTTDLDKVTHHFTLFKIKDADSVNQSVLRSMLVKEVMTAPVATIRPTTSLMTVAAIFRENLFHALPVVDQNEELVGIVTPYDLINYAYRADGMLIE